MVLRALAEESAFVAQAVAASPGDGKYDTGTTAGEWFLRRIKNQRIRNRKVGL